MVASSSEISKIRMKKQIWRPIIFYPLYMGNCETCNFFFQSAISPVRKIKIIHVNSEMESWKVAIFDGFLIFKK